MIKGMVRKYFILGVVFLLAPFHVFAASLYFSPSAKTVAVGQTFTVSVLVSSADQSMNAASGNVSFPSDKLRVLSVSKANSVMNLWVQDPTFTNSVAGGDVNFAGIALNPGFTGVGGNVVTMTFQPVATGVAALSFSDGSVLANDGNGTNILTSMGTAGFTITPAAAAPAVPTHPSPASPAPAPAAGVSAPDTLPPLPFVVSSVGGAENDSTDPQPIFTWTTSDAQSGIAKYMVKIGDGDWFDAATITVPGVANEYRLPVQAPEQNVSLAVEAYDGAGNMTEATTTFSVAPISAPSITSYTNHIVSGKTIFSVHGSMSQGVRSGGAQETTINLYLQRGDTVITYSAPTDVSGNWSLDQIVDLPAGTWTLYAQAADDRGALSSATPAVAVIIGGWVTDVIAFLLSWGAILAVSIILLGAIVAIAYLIVYHGRRFHLSLTRRLVEERRELRDDLKRIEKELEADHAESRIDLSAAGMHKKQERVRREIEHLEEDMKRDIKEND